MINKAYYKNSILDSLLFQSNKLVKAFDPSSFFLNNEQGFWFDPNPNIKDKWKVNNYTNTNDLTVSPNRSTISKTEDGFLLTITDVAAGGNTLVGVTYPVGATASLINGKTIVRSIEFKKGTASILRLGGASDNSAVFIDLNTLTVTRNAGNLPVVINALGSDWYRVETFHYSLAFGTTQISNFVGWGMSQTSSTIDSAGQVGSTINLRKPSFAVVNGESTASVPYQEVISETELFLSQHPQPLLFQDSAGTVPVTAADQPVGLMLDRSKGIKLGNELTINGNFDDLSNWTNYGTPTKSVQNGILRLEAAQSAAGVYQDITLPNYRTCKVVVRARKVSGTSVARITIMPRTGDLNSPNTSTDVNGSNFKDYIFYITRETAATGIRIYLQLFPSDVVLEVDSVSVKEIAGNHAYQSTSSSRPLLRYNSNTGAYHLAFDGVDDYLQIDGTSLPSPMTTVFAVDTSSATYGIVLSPANAGYFNTTSTGVGISAGTQALRKTPKDVVFFKAIDGKIKFKTSKAEAEITYVNTFATAASKYVGVYTPASGAIKFNGSIYGIIAITKDTTLVEEDQISAVFNRRLGI